MAENPDRSKVEAYLPLVAALAEELGDPGWPAFSAVQEANLVLMEVVAETRDRDLAKVLRVRVQQRFDEIRDHQ